MTQQPTYTGDPKAHPISEFASGMSGSCLCGSITVTIHDPDLFTKRRGHLCHCSNCRKTSGSYVAANFAIDKSAVEIQDKNGTLKSYDDHATGSGKKVVRSFCGVDGNSIMSEAELYPDKVVLKMGLFPRIPAPEAEAFGAHKHEWEETLEGVVQFETARGGKKLEG
ncbi:hypothetical protein CC78DRAFT_581272 [Lojkania enalia]|uniref:CENP-V/GFA domain-containing protein n=1 Tax=Lojkania enalia TaxID=147567 RepID=A0A9P4K657_9PLEO|nr:hypothetical protein CC78DRAFT_581272 [Didymosphaeria enalia]